MHLLDPCFLSFAKRPPTSRSNEELSELMMYNMSGGGGGTSLLGVSESGATPRTPEILNSLISMTNPFDRLRPAAAASPSQPESSPSPPSVQSTCSRLIKEGLKLTLQSKKRNNSCSSVTSPLLGARSYSGGGGTSPESMHCDTSNDGLTPEDEERRRRRRERNKIAATKCRQKKRERTNNLVYESEALETQNLDLKSKIQQLEVEKQKLVDVLTVHRSSCNKQPFTSSPAIFHEFVRTEYSGASYPSTSYEVVCTSESTSSSYHHQTRTASVIEEIGYSPNPYLYKDPRRDPIISYSRSDGINDELLRHHNDGVYHRTMETSRGYPLRLAASTSSSDYESNTELLDSPSAGYPIPDDPSSYSSSSSSIFPTSSCIT